MLFSLSAEVCHLAVDIQTTRQGGRNFFCGINFFFFGSVQFPHIAATDNVISCHINR